MSDSRNEVHVDTSGHYTDGEGNRIHLPCPEKPCPDCMCCERVSTCCGAPYQEERGGRCSSCGDTLGFACFEHDVDWPADGPCPGLVKLAEPLLSAGASMFPGVFRAP